MTKSLGLIETEGLAAGVEAADAAVKSANVELIGYELTKGGGWTTVKVQGDVGAVKAAVDAARIAAAKVNRVVSTRVIARPSAGLDILVHNPDTVGDASKETDMPKPPTPPEHPQKVNEEKELPEEPEHAPAPEVSAESPEPVKTDSKEVKAEDLDAAGQEQADVPASGSDMPEPDGAKETVEDSNSPEPEKKAEPEKQSEPEKKSEPEASAENEDAGQKDTVVVRAASKPAKRTATKGRKGGKRSNKNETTE